MKTELEFAMHNRAKSTRSRVRMHRHPGQTSPRTAIAMCTDRSAAGKLRPTVLMNRDRDRQVEQDN